MVIAPIRPAEALPVRCAATQRYVMVLIHSVDVKSGQPMCGQPERANWLWTAFTDEVTCAGCWLLVRERRARPRPEVARRDLATCS